MGRGILPQILNCHVPCKEETAKKKKKYIYIYIIIRERNTQKEGDQKQQKRVGIPSKKEGNPVEVKKKGGDPTKILENLNYSRVGFRQPTSSGG